MAELTNMATEAVAEAAEEVADQAETVAEISRSLTPRVLGFALVGGAVGAGIGWLISRKMLETKYEQQAENEITEMREHFRARLVAKETKPDLSDLGRKVEDLGYAANHDEPVVDAIVEEVVVEKNVFEEAQVTDEWDYEEEVALRRPEYPYVIHVDERHERNYTESTLTYYAGDDVLCDEQDKIIEDQDMVVGAANLDKFGHGSQDPAIVYIRNDQMAIEVEVVKSEKTYAEEVHGLSHSDPPKRVRRKRPRWDG